MSNEFRIDFKVQVEDGGLFVGWLSSSSSSWMHQTVNVKALMESENGIKS